MSVSISPTLPAAESTNDSSLDEDRQPFTFLEMIVVGKLTERLFTGWRGRANTFRKEDARLVPARLRRQLAA